MHVRSPHLLRRSAALAALAVAAVATPAQAAGPAAPEGAGTVVSAKEVRLKLGGLELVTPARAWRLEYRSTDVSGNLITTSAILAVPRKGATADRPLVGMGHGSEGLADKCAPSNHYVNGTSFEAPVLSALLHRGWAVVVADGQGLGTPGDPTYMVGQSAGRVMLDAVRAARAVEAAKLPAASPTGIWGYSEGGSTAAWANELQPTYAPDVELAGTVAGGTPADLLDAAASLNGGLFAAFLFQAAAGLDAAYPELDLESYLNAAGTSRLATLRKACVLQALPQGAFTKITTWVTTNPLDQPDWQARIAENQLGQARPNAPTYLFHGTQDEVLPYSSVLALSRRYCSLGAAVTLRSYRLSHFPTYAAGTQPAMTWLAERFRGRPVTAGCPGT